MKRFIEFIEFAFIDIRWFVVELYRDRWKRYWIMLALFVILLFLGLRYLPEV